MILNEDDFEPAIATCKDVLSPKESGAGSAGAAAMSGKMGSILAASTFATIMVVGCLIA
jgi:hypothetical protein